MLKLNLDYKVQLRQKHRLLAQNDHQICKVHMKMMENFDFWQIAPDEGKYAMAVAFHKSRAKAVVMAKWILIKDGVI